MFVNWRGPGLTNIFLAIGLIGWVTEARLIRGQFLSLREQEYVKASRVAGASGAVHHHAATCCPNSLTPIIVAADLRHPDRDLHRGGAQLRRRRHPPAAGELGPDGRRRPAQQYIRADPHMLLFPVMAIGLTMLGFTFLGDGLRDALDPKGND